MAITPKILVALSALVLVGAGVAVADPCLSVYPTGPCTFHYDPAKWYTVGPGNPLYDPFYDRGGVVLINASGDYLDSSIYQADLLGFVADTTDEGYYFDGGQFDLVIDGFANEPTLYSNVLVMFDHALPSGCALDILIDGVPLTGTVYDAGALDVHTPTPAGNNFSDVLVRHVAWSGCVSLHIWAFSDEDHDGRRDAGECRVALSHDLVVPVEQATWGGLKSQYR